MSNNTCSFDTCNEPHHAMGYCSKHYSRWKRHGDASVNLQPKRDSLSDALETRVARIGECLVWTGTKTNLGYGQIYVEGKLKLVHRVAWELENGSIPERMEIDHTCWSRACVNVNHLRIAEHKQNGRNLSGAHSRSKLGVRNVRKKGNRYQVSVGKTYIGSFKTLDEAKSVAEKERVARYGEFAGRG